MDRPCPSPHGPDVSEPLTRHLWTSMSVWRIRRCRRSPSPERPCLSNRIRLSLHTTGTAQRVSRESAVLAVQGRIRLHLVQHERTQVLPEVGGCRFFIEIGLGLDRGQGQTGLQTQGRCDQTCDTEKVPTGQLARFVSSHARLFLLHGVDSQYANFKMKAKTVLILPVFGVHSIVAVASRLGPCCMVRVGSPPPPGAGLDQAVSWPLFALKRPNPRTACESNIPIVLGSGLPFAAQIHFAENSGTRPVCPAPCSSVPHANPKDLQ